MRRLLTAAVDWVAPLELGLGATWWPDMSAIRPLFDKLTSALETTHSVWWAIVKFATKRQLTVRKAKQFFTGLLLNWTRQNALANVMSRLPQ